MRGISRSSRYSRPQPPSPEEVAIKQRIDERYTAHPFYGSRTLTVLLQEEFGAINRKRVQRYMREMGIAGMTPGPKLRKRHTASVVYPYLLRHITAADPDHMWGCDNTSIRLRHGWMYLVASSDWYSRYLVGWQVDDTLDIGFVVLALTEALARAQPVYWNTDQGSHVTSPPVIMPLQQAGVQISMDGKGRAIDTIFTERFWRSVKYEAVYLHEYDNPRTARAGIARYIDFYNTERPHQALAYQRPVARYRATGNQT